MNEFIETLLADPLGGRAEAALRRRDHRRRRPRAVDRLPPGGAARHHQRRGDRGRLHRVAATPAATRRSSAPTTASPKRSASTTTSVELYRGLEAETGAGSCTPDQGHHLDGPHRDGHARRTRPGGDEQGLRGETLHAHPAGDQGARPAARPDRRRPLPGAGRLVPRRRRDRPPRPGRVGVREQARRSAASTCSSTRGDRAHARRRPGRRRGDVARADRRRRGAQRGGRPRDPGRRHGRRPAAGADASAPRVRDQRLRPGLPDHPRQHRAHLLRLPDRAGPDADRRRVRRAASYSRQASFTALRSYS